MLGQEKTPVSWAAVRGSRVDAGGYARRGASAASTRFPITTSNPGVCITVDGSLRTGHRSNSRHRRGGQIRTCEPGAHNVRWEDGGVSSPPASAAPAAVVIRAEALSRKPGHIGAVAFSRTGDPATGDFGDAKIIKKFGEVPDDLSTL